MSDYRDILYRDYSATFADQKAYAPGIQHAQYESDYGDLLPPRDLSVVDLGCGKGEWLGWMASKGFSKLTGVDLSTSDLAIARSTGSTSCDWRQESVIQFLEDHPASFDLLHAKDIVEHFTKEEFLRFLVAARAALRPGGSLWVLTFNAQSPLASVTRYGDFSHEIGPTPSSMAQCLRACGFTEISVHGRHYCSRSLSGRVRRWIGAFIYLMARLIIQVRHGSSVASSSVELHTALPDLFARATLK